MPLGRDKLLAARVLPREAVKVPELADGDDDVVYVAMMDGVARDGWERWCAMNAVDKDGKPKKYLEGTREALIVYSVVDLEGKRLFTEDDIEAIRKWPGAVSDRLARVAQRVNKIFQSDLESAKGN